MEYLSIKDVALEFKVSEETVRRWVRDKKLNAENFGGRLGYRISRSELERFQKESKNTTTVQDVVDEIAIEAEITRIQQMLLDIESGKRRGMDASKALKLAAQLEGITMSLGAEHVADLSIISGPQKFTRSASNLSQEPKRYSLKEVLDDAVEELAFDYSDSVADDAIPALEKAIEKYRQSDSKYGNPIMVRKFCLVLESLLNQCREYNEKVDKGEINLQDAYNLAAEFRGAEEFMTARSIKSIEFLWGGTDVVD